MIDAPQRSPEWFAQRVGRVTGSAVGAILGLSPYQTREDVLRSMVRAYHKAPSEFTGNAATSWGTAMEAQAIGEFEMDTGDTVTPMPFIPWDDWLGASPDGRISATRLIEVKCPYGIRNDSEPAFKTLAEQPHYHAQCQIEMHCTSATSLWFYQWTPHGNTKELVLRDDAWLNENLPALRQFHAEYLASVQFPEEHLAPRRITIDTPQAHAMMAEWDDLAEQEARVKERKGDLLAEIAKMTGDRDALFAGRKVTKVEREGAVSYAKAIKSLMPDADLTPWKGKATSYWKVS